MAIKSSNEGTLSSKSNSKPLSAADKKLLALNDRAQGFIFRKTEDGKGFTVTAPKGKKPLLALKTIAQCEKFSAIAEATPEGTVATWVKEYENPQEIPQAQLDRAEIIPDEPQEVPGEVKSAIADAVSRIKDKEPATATLPTDTAALDAASLNTFDRLQTNPGFSGAAYNMGEIKSATEEIAREIANIDALETTITVHSSAGEIFKQLQQDTDTMRVEIGDESLRSTFDLSESASSLDVAIALAGIPMEYDSEQRIYILG